MNEPQVVAELWRYPAKSMQGERLDAADVDQWGIVGDRQWAAVDLGTGLALTAKREPVLLMCAARFHVVDGAPAIEIDLPDGATAHGEREASAALSALLGRPIELRRADPAVAATYEIAADFEREHESELLHWNGPAGTFHDSTKTRLSIAALSDMRDWAPRRFRANVLVTGVTTAPLVGRTLTIGGVTVEVTKHIDRCVLVTRAQPDGIDRDLDVLRTINAEMDGRLGVGSMVLRGGRIAVGDEVGIAAPVG